MPATTSGRPWLLAEATGGALVSACVSPFVGAYCLLRSMRSGFASIAMAERLARRWPFWRRVWLCSLVICTIAFIASCQATVQRSPSTVNVSGYFRRDGTYVSSYSRRGPGVAAADRWANAATIWLRVLMLGGWGVAMVGHYALYRSGEIGAAASKKPPGTIPLVPGGIAETRSLPAVLSREIDREFPQAGVNEVVEHRGERYVRCVVVTRGLGGSSTPPTTICWRKIV